MGKRRFLSRAGCGLLCAACGGIAATQLAPGGAGSAAAAAPAFASPATVYLGTREYVWTFHVPVLTTERVEAVARVLSPTVRSRRWNYELPDLKSQRYKLGQVAEFSCKYMDWQLPEECRTVWHDVYADLPVLTMRRDHLDFDVADWEWQERTMRIDLPRWTWAARTLTVSVPVVGPEDMQRAQATLDAQQAAAVKAIDAGIDALDAGIAAVEAQGANPRQLSTGGATSIDLPAMRQALREEKQNELERLAVIRAELANLGAAGPAATP